MVIVLIDTLRADRLGCYGHDQPTSPRIDQLARSGVLFERASAPAPWTLPTVPSLMTGLLPCTHGVLRDGDTLPASIPTLAQRLQALDYATYSLFSNPYAGPLTGLDRGFDVRRPVDYADGATVLEVSGGQVSTPVFFYIHNTEPHNAYEVPDEFVRPFGTVAPAVREDFMRRSKAYRRLTSADADAGRPPGTTDNTAAQTDTLRALDALRAPASMLYDAAVLEADTRVGSIVDGLRARGLWDDTLFILTSDHGEEMGEHGGWQHDQSLYEELLHVPLVVRFPGDRYAGRRVPDLVGLVDLVPTVMEVVGHPQPAGAQGGRSLLPLVRGEAGQPRTPTLDAVRINRKKYFRPWKERRGDVNVVVREETWKAIWNREPDTVELYDLGRDPGEQTDTSAANPERAARYRDLAETLLARCLAGARAHDGP